MTVTVTGGITFSGGLTFAPSSAAAANDPYFMYNSLLLPGNGTNLAQNNTFLDGSTNNFTITRAGNTTQGTFSPYGSNWSNYFGGSGNSLNYPSASQYAIGTGNFTVEFFVNFSALNAGHNRMFCIGTGGTDGLEIDLNSTTLEVGIQNGYPINYTWVPAVGTWYYIAVTRSGSSVTLYINGSSVATGTSSNSISQNSLTIGGISWQASWSINGYLSNVRLSNNVRTITTPTTPYTSDANTLFLSSQSNRFLDNSSYSATATITGSPTIQRFSPFEPSAAYDTSTIGGSGYFDGAGDYITYPSNAVAGMNFGSGDFTVEGWVYPIVTPGDGAGIFAGTSGSTSPVLLGYNSSIGSWVFGRNFVTWDYSFSQAPILNTWQHLAVSRSGTTLKLFFNGVLKTTVTTSQTYSMSGGGTQGFNGSSGYVTGYISDARATNTALYTATFTPPTAPLTAIANTSILLSTTNAGIIDNAMMNNLETVGNAQISTTQSKFGGSSMAFDGTGDWIQAPNNAIYNLGSGDFTIEFWLYVVANPSVAAGVITKASNAGNTGYTILYYPTGFVGFAIGSGGLSVQTAASSIPLTTWTYVAITRSGTSGKFFINGTQSGSTGTINNFTDSSTVLAIGALDTSTGWNGPYPLNGYIDDLRITKGYARYTTTFTPPTQAFPLY